MLIFSISLSRFSLASNFYPDSGRPYSPSSYTTLPAQMVYFTFP